MTKKDKKYFEGLGRRKESVARVRVSEAEKEPGIVVNDKEMEDYFTLSELREAVLAPMKATSTDKKLNVSIKVNGGGIRGQAEASKMGISRALVRYSGDYHQTLKDLDYLKRDSRKKERKKPGFKKARRAAQWRKR
ncbi:MAG: 30S ribosomal protein S9 [Candidatus Moraniibacteriota bacterium]